MKKNLKMKILKKVRVSHPDVPHYPEKVHASLGTGSCCWMSKKFQRACSGRYDVTCMRRKEVKEGWIEEGRSGGVRLGRLGANASCRLLFQNQFTRLVSGCRVMMMVRGAARDAE